MHPDTLVLDKDGSYRSESYSSYYSRTTSGVIGESNPDQRLNRKEYVLGVSAGSNTKAYAMRNLVDESIVNDSLGVIPMVVYYKSNSSTALAYERLVDGQEVTFLKVDLTDGPLTRLMDQETPTIWQAFTGRAIEGLFKGTILTRMTPHHAFWFGWTDYYPGTELF